MNAAMAMQLRFELAALISLRSPLSDPTTAEVTLDAEAAWAKFRWIETLVDGTRVARRYSVTLAEIGRRWETAYELQFPRGWSDPIC